MSLLVRGWKKTSDISRRTADRWCEWFAVEYGNKDPTFGQVSKSDVVTCWAIGPGERFSQKRLDEPKKFAEIVGAQTLRPARDDSFSPDQVEWFQLFGDNPPRPGATSFAGPTHGQCWKFVGKSKLHRCGTHCVSPSLGIAQNGRELDRRVFSLADVKMCGRTAPNKGARSFQAFGRITKFLGMEKMGEPTDLCLADRFSRPIYCATPYFDPEEMPPQFQGKPSFHGSPLSLWSKLSGSCFSLKRVWPTKVDDHETESATWRSWFIARLRSWPEPGAMHPWIFASGE